MPMPLTTKPLYALLLVLLLGSCYQQGPLTSDAWSLTERQVDSISFYSTHHYTQNFNFRVRGDSLPLIVQHPTEAVNGLPVDTIVVYHDDRLVVADITQMQADSIDSVWVKVARDQTTQGWARESQLLQAVSPDAPISQFIDYFSDTHLLFFLAFFSIVVAAYIVMRQRRRNAMLVHFNDIRSFYPMLLALLVAASAVFYSTIQLHNPESWRHYYYHPTLNPFAVPPHIGLFLLSVWSMIIVGIAALDDVRRQLPLPDSLIYCLGLAGVCAFNYTLFSLSTLYYVGYPLLAVYICFALWMHWRHGRAPYRCGHCGEPLKAKGICPKCGANNV